jgi:hypothetical protein
VILERIGEAHALPISFPARGRLAPIFGPRLPFDFRGDGKMNGTMLVRQPKQMLECPKRPRTSGGPADALLAIPDTSVQIVQTFSSH